MAYSANDRSERILQSRRFTSDALSAGAEALTKVFDLGANEIYTDDGLIPTGSSQLLYSGSSQDGGIISGSIVNPDIETDIPVLKYWYRKPLKGAGDGSREVYYFTTSDPSTHDDYVTSDSIIETDQEVNFISPKYMDPGLSPSHAGRTAEADQDLAGYKVVISQGANAGSATVVTDEKYVFDYKTGVLSWVDGYGPGATDFVFATLYQYVGRTLRSQIDDGTIGGGNVESVPTASVIAVTDEDSSGLEYGIVFAHTGSGVNLFTDAERGTSATRYGLTYTPNTNTLTIGTLANAKVVINENELYANTGGSGLSFNLFTADSNLQTLNFGNAATTIKIAGDLEVNGTVTSIQTDNLNVSDQFILLASGSSGTKDGGIIVQSGSNGVGTALYFDADANRWAVNPANTVNWDDTALTPKQYVVSVSASADGPSTTPLDFGTTSEYYGMMHVNTDTGDIYIYS